MCVCCAARLMIHENVAFVRDHPLCVSNVCGQSLSFLHLIRSDLKTRPRDEDTYIAKKVYTMETEPRIHWGNCQKQLRSM